MLRGVAGWLFLSVTVVAAVLAMASVEDRAVRLDRLTFAQPGDIVQVGSSSWHLNCSGTVHPGVPTVVLEAGLGESSVTWADLQDRLDESLRVCAYDRLGYGWSGDAEGERSAAIEARELHELLEAAGEARPLVLVAHSLGALIVQSYAEAFPDSVRAIVLLDPTSAASVTGPQVLPLAVLPLAVNAGQEALARLGVLRPFAASLASGEPDAPAPHAVTEQAAFLYQGRSLRASMMELAAAPDSAAEVANAKVEQPTLVLLPREATETRRAEIRAMGGDVSIRTVDTDAHYLHYADPSFVANAIRDIATKP